MSISAAALEKELLSGIVLSRAFNGSQDPSSRGAKPLLQKGPSKDPQGSVRRPLLSGLRIKRVGLGPFSLCGGRSHNGLSGGRRLTFRDKKDTGQEQIVSELFPVSELQDLAPLELISES